MGTELRPFVLGDELDPRVRALGIVVNRLVNRDNGAGGGRLWLLGDDDGIRREIRGGAEVDTGNYRFRVTSGGGNHEEVLHSDGVTVLRRTQDSGITQGATTIAALTVTTTSTLTGNVSMGGTLHVTGATTLDGAVTLGDAAADAITVKGTATFNENVVMAKNLTVDTTTLVVDAANNKVGILTATPRSWLEVASHMWVTGHGGFPTAGEGLESYYLAGTGFIDAYSYTAAVYRPLSLAGLSVQIKSGTTKRIEVDATGIGFFATAPVGQPAAGGAADGTLGSATTLVNSLRTGLRALGLFS